MNRRSFFKRSAAATAVTAGTTLAVVHEAKAELMKPAKGRQLELDFEVKELLERPDEHRGYPELEHDAKVRYTLTQKVIAAEAPMPSKAAALRQLVPEMNRGRPVMAEDFETTNDMLRFLLGVLAGE